MSFSFPRFVAGQSLLEQLSAERMNAMLDAIEECQLWEGANVCITRGPGGSTISADAPSDSPDLTHNYQVYDVSTEEETKISVRPGNHNNVIPDIDGTPINEKIEEEYPALTVNEEDTIVWFQLNLDDDGDIENIEMHSGETLPENDETTVYQICAMIEIKDGHVINLEGGVSGSQWFQMCNATPLFGLQ